MIRYRIRPWQTTMDKQDKRYKKSVCLIGYSVFLAALSFPAIGWENGKWLGLLIGSVLSVFGFALSANLIAFSFEQIKEKKEK